MAHQWFGDLVTMAWWNDLWLNEGFASWMGTKATNALRPEWEPASAGSWRGAADEPRLRRHVPHPIVQKIETVEQISQAFDSITYRKGEAVLTMLEDYVGEDAWRQGVRDYIATYRLRNTVTDNLWEGRARRREAGDRDRARLHVAGRRAVDLRGSRRMPRRQHERDPAAVESAAMM